MKRFKSVFVLIVFSFLSFACFSQSEKTIDSLQNQYQGCLDKGECMLCCTQIFYAQMDSLLNVTYFKLRSTLDSTDRKTLYKSQKNWLKKRDAYFKKALTEFENENGGIDDMMIMDDKNAQYVEARVLILLERFKK
ncbi:MAG TPA: lysozyme inhibitor LprI family protein [Bacteroidia bacterium]|nr:lysozyme inhibitor LprI family protein [Bacteroidia bacterium]